MFFIRPRFITFVLFISFFFVDSVSAQQRELQVAKNVIDLGELSSGRPASITLWFPESHCESLAKNTLCLADTAVTDRTIVLTHGAMGAADNYQWLGEALAQAGYIVVGINHFGESWFYGAKNQDVTAASMVWQRPEDISAVYDILSNRSLFQKNVNWSNVIAIGHSSGGQTVAMLAGVQFDLQQVLDFCKSSASELDHSCDYGARHAALPSQIFLEKMSGNYHDTRVKKIIMLDPTLGYGATPQSLAKITLPTLIVGAKNNDFLPWENHGVRYLSGMTQAKSYLLTGQEGHFVFLDACHEDIQVMGVPLCKDREGVDRSATHELLKKVIIEFVQENNIAIDSANIVKLKKSSTFHLPQMPSFIIYTPIWVWGLLVGLIGLGLTQVRSRRVPYKAVFILPIVMIVMSLMSTITTLGFTILVIALWLSGVLLATVLLQTFLPKVDTTFDKNTKQFLVTGSWWPLVIILCIFCGRYVLAVSMAMNSPVIHASFFVPVVSSLLGACSGYFVARGIGYLKILKKSMHNTN